MYQGEDRVKQVDALRELAANLTFYEMGQPEDKVAYYLETNDMPGWFDEHDRQLLVEMTG